MDVIPNVAESLVSQAASGKISQRWYSWLQQMAAQVNAFNPALYAKLAGAAFTGPVSINGGTQVPLTLITTSGAPWALELTRTDVGSTVRVYNDNGLWNFNESLFLNNNITVSSQAFFSSQGKCIGGPNNSGMYLNYTDGYSYFDTQNGLYIRYNGGSATAAKFDSVGTFWATSSVVAGSGAYYSNNGATRLMFLDVNDGWLRINQTGDFTSGAYTPNNLRIDRALFLGPSQYIEGNAVYSYGSIVIETQVGGYFGLALADGAKVATFMSDGVNSGIYNQGAGYWTILDDNSYLRVGRPVVDGGAANAYLRHVSSHISGQVFVSTASPSGGNDGDIWLKYT